MAMPADSWPRCWSAKRPVVATSAAWTLVPGGRTAPKTPHISATLQSARLGWAAWVVHAERPAEAVLPGVREIGEGDVDRIGDPRSSLLGGARRARPGEIDDQAIPADGS